MKIVFVAVFNENSTNWSQSLSLKEIGCDVIEFNYREIASQIGNKSRDDKLVEVVKTEKPDMVLFSKCNEIDNRVVVECNKVSKTFLWYMDPVNGNFSQSLVKKIRSCTHTFCALWNSYSQTKKLTKNVSFLHEGYDQYNNKPVDMAYVYDSSFIGQLRGHRFEYHKRYPFDVISNAYGFEHSKAVSSTKVNLNFTQGGTSDRTYKILASKGFLLTERWPEMEKDFIIGEDLVTFENVDEMVRKIDFYVKNEEERLRIATNGYNKGQKFSRLNWAKKIVEEI